MARVLDTFVHTLGVRVCYHTKKRIEISGLKGFTPQWSKLAELRSMEYQVENPSDELPLFLFNGEQVAMTEAGVSYAIRIHDRFSPIKNVTAVWFDGWIVGGSYSKVLTNLTHHASLGKEKASDEVVDHLHNFIASCIARDSFKKWLERGDTPSDKQITDWTVRRAISTFRKFSRDALGRHTRGALTDDERANGGPTAKSMVASTFTTVLQSSNEENPPEDREQVIIDNDIRYATEHMVAWEDGISRVREALRSSKAGAPDRYLEIFNQMVEGYSVAEIGELNGVSRNRGAGLKAGVKKPLRQLRVEVSESRRILAYLLEEPFATLDDIKSDVPTSTPKQHLLNRLLECGRVSLEKGSYTLTPSGESILSLSGNDLDFGDLITF